MVNLHMSEKFSMGTKNHYQTNILNLCIYQVIHNKDKHQVDLDIFYKNSFSVFEYFQDFWVKVH